MRLVMLQPSYLPWLGYFDQMYKSDLFILYDDAQYDKHGWRNRNRIKTAQGPLWLTVPVLTHGQGLPTNRDARIDARQPWARKHLQALRINDVKAVAFAEVFDTLALVLEGSGTHLCDLNRAVELARMQFMKLERGLYVRRPEQHRTIVERHFRVRRIEQDRSHVLPLPQKSLYNDFVILECGT